MGLVSKLAALTMAAGLVVSMGGCESAASERRPDMDQVLAGDRGVQCADLREMSSRLTPQVMQCEDIVRNPYKIVVVMKHMENKTTSMPGQDMDIFLAGLQSDLGSFAASHAITFKLERARVAQFQAEEGARTDPFEQASRTGAPVSTEATAQYILDGTVYSLGGGRSTYYLFVFRLSNLSKGTIAWQGKYEVRTLN